MVIRKEHTGNENDINLVIKSILGLLMGIIAETAESPPKKGAVKKEDGWEFSGLLDMPNPKFKGRVAKSASEWEFSGLCDL